MLYNNVFGSQYYEPFYLKTGQNGSLQLTIPVHTDGSQSQTTEGEKLR